MTVQLERMVVNESKEFARVVREQIAKAKTQVEIIPSNTVETNSIVDQIARLSEFHNQGLLTAEEFAIAKSKILNQP